MAFRLCLAFCLLSAASVSMVRSTMEARLRERLRSDSWVDRANAAVLLADNPRAVRWLLPASMDEAPPVRENARWALHRLTGLPWASQPDECAEWWLRSQSVAGPGLPAPPDARDDSWEYGVPEVVDLNARCEDGALMVSIENRSQYAMKFASGIPIGYSAILYSRLGAPAAVLDPPEPGSGVVETRIWDLDGRRLQTWYWKIHRLRIDGGRSAGESYDLSAFPKGHYIAECVAGPFVAFTDDLERSFGFVISNGERRFVLIDR